MQRGRAKVAVSGRERLVIKLCLRSASDSRETRESRSDVDLIAFDRQRIFRLFVRTHATGHRTRRLMFHASEIFHIRHTHECSTARDIEFGAQQGAPLVRVHRPFVHFKECLGRLDTRDDFFTSSTDIYDFVAFLFDGAHAHVERGRLVRRREKRLRDGGV